MYYRRKVLLAFLQIFEGKLEKISFQKLLFLFAKKQEQKTFHFVPYKFGCFSFQANADLHTLEKYGQIEEFDKFWVKTSDNDYFNELKPKDQQALRFVKKQFGTLDKNKLIELTYKKYPYFAINSIIATNILNTDHITRINEYRPAKTTTVLFTIGYEGISLEEYLNKLIINDIKVLCDVRKNALSMKYGFAKKTLQNACESLNIKYLHLPELGIVSAKRKSLNNQTDYDNLFVDYEKTVLPLQNKAIKFIHELLINYGRVALTCFEAIPEQCHRTRVASAVHDLEKSIPLKHL